MFLYKRKSTKSDMKLGNLKHCYEFLVTLHFVYRQRQASVSDAIHDRSVQWCRWMVLSGCDYRLCYQYEEYCESFNDDPSYSSLCVFCAWDQCDFSVFRRKCQSPSTFFHNIVTSPGATKYNKMKPDHPFLFSFNASK